MRIPYKRIFAFASVCAFLWWALGLNMGFAEYERLLNGDQHTKLVNATIRNQQRAVECTDVVALDFVTEVIRSPIVEHFSGGTSYDCHAVFHTGHRHAFNFCLECDERGVYLFTFQTAPPFGWDEGYYMKTSHSEVPPAAAVLLQFLDAPTSNVAGLRLILAEGEQPRFEFDEALLQGRRGKRVDAIVAKQAF